MALVVADRVKQTAATISGTGTYTLSGTFTGFQTFTDGVGDGNTTYYAAVQDANFEIGIGTYTASGTTLARTTILQSSNSDNAVNWSSATPTIFTTYPADKAVFKDASNNINGTFVGNLTGTLQTAAQANITSVGTLSSLTTSGDITVGDDLTVEGGQIDLRSNSGAVGKMKFYCEVSNAHAQTLQAQPHSASSSAVLTLPVNTGTLVGTGDSGSVSNTMLGGSIANSKLANSSINFGGVSLALGASDTTPAFDLSDATNYPTSSLSGTITNAQLAGSIADTKLDTISTAGKVAISALDIDGGTDIGAALADSDEIIVDDGGGGTNRRADMSRVKTYIADVTLTTAAQTNITSVGTLTNFTTSGDVTMTGSGDGSLAGPLLNIIRDSASPADNDNIGAIIFKGDDSAGNVQQYAGIHGRMMDVTDGSEDGRIEFKIRKDGSAGLAYAFDPSKFTLANEGSIEFFEHGGTSYDVTLAAATPSADRTVTLPDATGTVITTGNTSDVTTVGTLTTLTVDNVIINGSTIGHTGDTDLMTVASGVLTVAGEVDATSLDISGDADIDGTLEADAITVNGTALNTVIANEATALAIALG